MTEVNGASESAENIQMAKPVKPKRKMRRLTKWLLWIGAIGLVVLIAIGGTAAYYLRRAEPMLRAGLIDTLQKRFNAHVELDNLHVSIADGFWVEGSGLRIWLPDTVQQQSGDQAAAANPELAAQAQRHSEPWITVSKMRFHTSWRILPGKPIVVSVIYVEGVKVVLPPKEERAQITLSGKKTAHTVPTPEETNPQPSQPAQPSTQAQSSYSGFLKLPEIQVRKVQCKNATLLIERTQEPGKVKEPLDFEFANVILFPGRQGEPIAFDVNMTNAKPVGQIHSVGHVGPWARGDIHALPVEGNYNFDNADLGTIKGIEGILSSTGHYSGTLSQIIADGTTRTPDFRLERIHKGTGVLLTTKFHAIVDGTNGNTDLEPVDAMLGHTHIVARGKVLRADDISPGAKGHDIALDVIIDRGHIQDVLQIAAGTDQPFMVGDLTLKTKLHLPWGKESVMDKLQLDGQFHLTNVQFSNETMQGRIRQLSLRGQGRAGDVKTAEPEVIYSEMQGHFKLGGGSLQLPDMTYKVPGAVIAVHGKYGMQAGALDFEGDAKLDATLSRVVGGWKGLLLKPADHYLKKNGAGTDVPIHVRGTKKSPEFGVDFDRMGKDTDKDHNAGDSGSADQGDSKNPH